MEYVPEFLFNNVRVKLVAVHPETGIAFYVNNGIGGVFGVRVYPDGRKTLVNATATTGENCKNIHNAKRKQRYLHFGHAFGHCKQILVSHAVYIAWRGKPVPAGMTIDHIDGCTTNNYIGNLRCVSNEINNRDGGFLRKLRKNGIKTTNIQRPYLLRFYERMAKIKASITEYRYERLTRDQLSHILYDPEFSIPV